MYIQNLATSDATLITGSSIVQNLNRIQICNTEASASASIDLYIQDKSDNTSKTYILNNTTIPNGATLVLENEDLYFEWTGYDLYIQEGSGKNISIITF